MPEAPSTPLAVSVEITNFSTLTEKKYKKSFSIVLVALWEVLQESFN